MHRLLTLTLALVGCSATGEDRLCRADIQRRYRKLKGMTQEQLALEVEMERSYISDLERGTRNPSVRALARLAVALSVEPAELLKS